MALVSVSSAEFGEDERLYLLDAFDSGYLSGTGPFVKRFEEAFAKLIEARHAVACCSGTAALHLALRAIDVGPGDQVIVPDLTYVATANAVSYCGATPVFADVEPYTWCVSPRTVAPLIRERTVAIVPVHLYGNPCPMRELRDLARDKSVYLIEDAAQAHTSITDGLPVGSYSDAAVFSFYGNKLMTTGEGGMVTTKSTALRDSCRSLLGHAMDPDRRYWHTDVGYNYRMPNICAAVGLGQLGRVRDRTAYHHHLVSLYRQHVSHPLELIDQRPPDGSSVSSWWIYTVDLGTNERREAVSRALADAGFETRPMFPQMSQQPFHVPTQCPVAARLSRSCLSLPTGPHVTENHVKSMAQIIGGALEAPLSRGSQ